MNRISLFVLLGVCTLALGAASLSAKERPAESSAAQPQPGSEPLDVGETPEAAQEHGDAVAAIVNDTVITDYDLRQRLGLYVATSGAHPDGNALKQIRSQILEQLETERIELLEAQKNNISVSAADVDKALANILKDNHMTEDQLKQVLGRGGVKISTMRAQLAGQIAWSKTVQEQYGDRIDVSADDVNTEMQRLAEGKNKPHYLAAEIFEAVDNPEDDTKILKNMEDLENQLHSGAPFAAVARQFSQNPTAAQGGDLGMVVDGQLPKELNDALSKMKPGMISEPIRSSGGYYILALRQRLEGEGTKIPEPAQQVDTHPSSLPLGRILLAIGPKPPKDLLERVVQVAGSIRDHISSCDQLPDLAKQAKGIQVFNLGTMPLSELSPEIQKALAQTEPGEVTAPFQSAAGVELIVRCDKAAPKLVAFQMPSRDDIEQQLFEDRMGVLSRQYLRDLKRDADIELPGQNIAERHRIDGSNQ